VDVRRVIFLLDGTKPMRKACPGLGCSRSRASTGPKWSVRTVPGGYGTGLSHSAI